MAFDWKAAGQGAGTGGAIGSVAGPWGTAIGAGVGGLAAGFFGGQSPEDLQAAAETPIQKKKRELIDELLSGVKGQGPYSDLFTANDQDFERSFAEPARARFRNQTAPQIQQAYVASGQHRGTGLEDTLTRAGVDMDSLLNQSYLDYQQGAQNRRSNALSGILGAPEGALPKQSYPDQYFQSDQFKDNFKDILKSFMQSKGQTQNNPNSLMDTYEAPRKGFESETPYYNPYTGVMG